MNEYEYADLDCDWTDFPKWVPDDVVEEWCFYELMYEDEKAFINNMQKLMSKSGRYQDYGDIDYFGTQPKSSEAQKVAHNVLHTLITHKMMKAVWESINKQKIPSVIITKIIISIYMRSKKVHVMETPLQQKKSIKDIKKKSKELADLIEGTGLEGYLALDFRQWLDDETLRHVVAMQEGVQMHPSPTRDYHPPKMSFLLKSLSKDADKYYNRESMFLVDEKVAMGKTNDSFAPRNYFIREVTKKMVQMQGEKNVLMVAGLANVLFHDGHDVVDDKKVRQATKNIKFNTTHEAFKDSIKESLEIKEFERLMGYTNPFDGF